MVLLQFNVLGSATVRATLPHTANYRLNYRGNNRGLRNNPKRQTIDMLRLAGFATNPNCTL
eukprot:4766931-Lingulodinium_polyedra.AAC.1